MRSCALPQQYKGLDAASLSDEGVAYAQANLNILCGLYGTLRPLDIIQAYRLEMATKKISPDMPNLANYWKNTITERYHG